MGLLREPLAVTALRSCPSVSRAPLHHPAQTRLPMSEPSAEGESVNHPEASACDSTPLFPASGAGSPVLSLSHCDSTPEIYRQVQSPVPTLLQLTVIPTLFYSPPPHGQSS